MSFSMDSSAHLPPRFNIEQSPSLSDPQPLRLVKPEILTALDHLDLSTHDIFKESKVFGAGIYDEDVISAHCTLPWHGKKELAIKRLRIFMAEDFQTVRHKGLEAFRDHTD